MILYQVPEDSSRFFVVHSEKYRTSIFKLVTSTSFKFVSVNN
jgi:hypothetical protein